MKRIAKFLFGAINARDVLGFGGLAMLAAGLWFVWPPLAAIVPGALLVYVTMLKVAV